MWHDSQIWKHITNMCDIIQWCATWLINVWLDWRIHIWIIHICMCDATYQHVTWLTNMTCITNMYVIIHSCATWLIITRHDSWRTCSWCVSYSWIMSRAGKSRNNESCRDMTHSHVTWLIHMWHDSLICDLTYEHVRIEYSDAPCYPVPPPPPHAPWPTPYTHTLTFNASRALSLSFWNTYPHTHTHFLNLFLSHSPSLLCSFLHPLILSHTHSSGSRYFKIGWHLWVMPCIDESCRTFSWLVYI